MAITKIVYIAVPSALLACGVLLAYLIIQFGYKFRPVVSHHNHIESANDNRLVEMYSKQQDIEINTIKI